MALWQRPITQPARSRPCSRRRARSLTTEDEYGAASWKALARAGAVGAVSTITGGAAGAYVDGLTTSLAARGLAGRVAANTAIGVAGGAAGGVGARMGSDLVDGEVSGVGDYTHDALMGGAIGGGLGGGLTMIGAAGARYLPESVKTPLHRLVARFPAIADDEVFAAFQRLGRQHSQGVVTCTITARRLLQLAGDNAITLSAEAWRSVRQFGADTRALGAAARGRLVQLADDVADITAPQFAAAGAGDASLTVTMKAARPLHEPGPLDGPVVTVIKAERLGDDLVSRPGDDAGSLFDDYGHGASYADDAADWRPAEHEEVSDLPLGLQDDRVSVVDAPPRERDPNRPTWQDSERHVTDALDGGDFTDQTSFLDGKEVARGTRDSTRPDNYSRNQRLSVDVKNYGLRSARQRQKLVKDIVEQMRARAQHLPAGSRQSVVIDARGQTLSPATLESLRASLLQDARGMLAPDDIVIMTE